MNSSKISSTAGGQVWRNRWAIAVGWWWRDRWKAMAVDWEDTEDEIENEDKKDEEL